MPDKRGTHQAKSHRNSKNKNRNDAPSGKARGQASLPGNAAAAVSTEDTVSMPAVGKKNKSKR